MGNQGYRYPGSRFAGRSGQPGWSDRLAKGAGARAPLLALQPVLSPGYVDLDRHGQLDGPGHLLPDDLAVFFDLLKRRVEYELIMNLDEEPHIELLAVYSLVEIDHSLLDHVRRASLDNGVDCQAFAKSPEVPVVGVDFRNRPAAAEHGRYEAVFFGLADAGLHESRYARIAFLVFVDELRGFGTGDSEPPRQPEGALSVDNAEVDSLRPASLLSCHLVLFDSLELGGDEGVNVLVGIEGLPQPLVFRKMGEDAELDLRIVQ